MLLEQIAEVLKVIRQRIVEPIVDEPVPLAEFVGVWEQIVDVPVPRSMEDDVGVVRSTPQERVHYCELEQITELPVPQFLGERVQDRTPEHGIPVPQFVEERVQNRTPELVVDVSVPQIVEVSVDIVPSTPQELAQNLVGEQIVGVCLRS